jgi:Zn-finger in ubiquitin-hydrolases and other protein
MLEFDFEKVCSVTMLNLNVYGCLVCGKYFTGATLVVHCPNSGRGKSTPAYAHSINEDHHVYINLQTLKVYILPENYEVRSAALDDIKHVVNPTFTKEQVAKLDKDNEERYTLVNDRYLPGSHFPCQANLGFVGINNIKANDYENVVIQLLTHVPPLRNFFILENLDHRPELGTPPLTSISPSKTFQSPITQDLEPACVQETRLPARIPPASHCGHQKPFPGRRTRRPSRFPHSSVKRTSPVAGRKPKKGGE